MGLLAPLYLAALAALSLPLIFHLVRRTPRGRQVFSSLMFLSPTPPQLTRRSRLDQILLLFLRAAALAVLAFAFARPFLRESALLALENLPSRRVAIVIDTSASLRRADLWPQAVKRANDELDDLNPQDEVALYTFDDRLRTIVDFKTGSEDPSVRRSEVVRKALQDLRPSWNASDLGTALVTVAGELDAVSDVKQSPADPQVVLISDFAKGSKIDALQSYEWPERVRVVAHRVEAKKPTNAFAHPLADPEGTSPEEVRVRVVNSADATSDQFFVGWGDDALKKRDESKDMALYVPPGQSRVVKLKRSTADLSADRILLRGDEHDFDNNHYLVPLRKQTVRLLYVGDDPADDPQGLQYYLRLAVADDPFRQVEVQPLVGDAASVPTDAGSVAHDLVVVSRALAPELRESLGKYLENGGLVVVVPGEDTADLLSAFFDDVEVQKAEPLAEGKFLLLGEIDFTHPLFVAFANPRYSDFTKIQFWQRRAVTLKPEKSTHVAARFDNGDPAVLDRSIGKGRVIGLTSGWSPDDSQLALSGKFVPLVASLIDLAAGGTEPLTSVAVRQPAELPKLRALGAWTVVKPGGQKVTLEDGATVFTDTDVPGVYRLTNATEQFAFAVNVPQSESNTAPLNLELLEQHGVQMGTTVKSTDRLDRMRQQRDTELESRQKVWRWLVVAALAVLIGETVLAGWFAIKARETARTA